MVDQATSARAAAVLRDGALQELRGSFRGELIGPADARYDEARAIFNGMIDRRPGLIARCASVDDVVAAVKFGRRHDLLVAVRGGGHGVTGYAVCDDGMVIDLSGMKGMSVDPQARTARAEAGLTWGEFDAKTQAHGLAVTGGRVTSTGIAGLTLGSGSGWLERKLGYTSDSLTSAQVVTADGSVITASEEENADLFWGLRGGSGNFGIVTSFEYRLHPIGPMVLGGILGYSREGARDLLRFYRDYMAEAPDEMGGAFAAITAPPEPFVPEEIRGTPVIGIVVCYAGDPEEGEKVVAPLRALKPQLNLVQPMPYTAVQSLLEAGNPPGLQNYWKADFYDRLSDEAIDAFVTSTEAPPSPFHQIIVEPLGGAVARVAEDASALSGRSAAFAIHALGLWSDAADSDRQIAWIRRLSEALKPFAMPGVHLNFIGDEGEERVRSTYGQKYQRLVALKNKYDPTNFFHMNQNIKPTV